MTTKTKLTFSEKSVYGNVLFYPQNDAAKAICEVACRKTFSIKELKRLDDCFEIEMVREYAFPHLTKKDD